MRPSGRPKLIDRESAAGDCDGHRTACVGCGHVTRGVAYDVDMIQTEIFVEL